MELIVTEKEIAARNIADILSGGSATVEQRNGVNVYAWGGRRCMGLSGHVVESDFPTEYSNWRDVEPVELADAPIEKRTIERAENIVRTLRLLARDADGVVIATDYDREGELIGKEAVDIVREVTDAPVERARYSSMTEREVRAAFAELTALDDDLAAAGEARQEIDLRWGAALTRFLSLVSGRRGQEFISVGRVQSPTLKLIVDREREIEAFEPETYWELSAALETDDGDTRSGDSAGEASGSEETGASEGSFEAQYFDAEAGRGSDRVWEAATAERVDGALREATNAEVVGVARHTRTDDPPHPFDTTQFISAAGSLGYSASRAMSLAEDLYTAGYISYPRTDNTVYPTDLDVEERLSAFLDHPEFGADAGALLEGDRDLTPTEGDEETTDHPPIHPTDELPSAAELGDAEASIYELVARRFFATLAEPAEWEQLRVTVAVGNHRLKANGKRLLDPGYLAVYPYASSAETHLPDVSEGERLSVREVRREEKRTQPPGRRGQSALIETMEEMGIGTKSSRHETIERLYERGYVEDDPPRPTTLAKAVVDAAETFAEQMVSEAMTSRLEADMDAIARGESSLEEVTEESRELLEAVFAELEASREDVGDLLRESLRTDATLGPCPECGSDLLVRRSRHGSHFVGCDGYPDCEYTLPLPSTGEPTLLEATCEEHDLRHVKLLAGSKTFVHGCPMCRAAAADAEPDRLIGDCPDCGETAGGELAIKSLRTGSRLVGCTRYPDCEYSLPLPRRGDIEVTDERCGEHALPELVVHDEDDDDPWELGCPICNFATYEQRRSADGLEAIDGIGEKTADKLADAGVESLADLRGATAEGVADAVSGVSAEAVRKWQTDASAGADAD
ncbi:DNA topoisomerase I [Halobacteriales archaeon QS_4_69_34]|nr:MAG: DNA topoisomerase I [Halobacteriales archaeon QS_4_69_34]